METISKFDWPWAKFCRRFRNGGKTAKKKAKTVNIFFGFFLIVNYCLGTGFLGIPYAFFYGGYLAAIPTILFISVVSWINANYLLEVMARAQVYKLLADVMWRSFRVFVECGSTAQTRIVCDPTQTSLAVRRPTRREGSGDTGWELGFFFWNMNSPMGFEQSCDNLETMQLTPPQSIKCIV